jgi:two-component system cell cycle response regulator
MKQPTLRVLMAIADAEESQRLQALLTSWQCEVETAASAAEVLLRLEDGDAPSVVLLDADLPDRGGIEVVRELHLRTAQARLWTVILSASPDSTQVLQAKDAGVDDLLVRPFDDLELRVRLHTAARVLSLHAELRQQTEAVRYHATHDNLTGLWNRESILRMLFVETDRVQRMRTPLSMLLIDLDQFTNVNLDYGYAAGDKLLKQIGTRLHRYLRSYDLIGRCGEDEFLIGLPGCTASHAYEMAERLRKGVLHKPFDVGAQAIRVQASFGIASSKGRSPLVVFHEAERALAEAKLGGGDRIAIFGTAGVAARLEPLNLPG